MATEVRRTNDKYEVCLEHGNLGLRKLTHSGEGNAKLQERSFRGFPEKGGSDIACVELTSEFLIYGTKNGNLLYYYLDESAGPYLVSEYTHCGGEITRLWPNSGGTRLLFEDAGQIIYLHNPLNDQAILVPAYAGKLDVAFWDSGDSLVFLLSGQNQISLYIYSPVNIHGSKVSFIEKSALPFGVSPVSLQHGTLTCKHDDGAMETTTLPTYSLLKKSTHCTEELRERFGRAVILLHFAEAFEEAKLLNCPRAWEVLIKEALEQMELETAMKACQYSKNLKLLTRLQKLEHLEEYHLLAGHILLLLENYDAAQESFLKSSYPEAAVEMRRDLEHWHQAMALARELKSPLQATILKGYAHALEADGDYRQALSYYEELLKSNFGDSKEKYFSQAGVARISIHLGDIWKGKQLAKECNNSLLFRDCAKILEGLNLLQDAAEIYELDGQLEKAVSIYITLKSHVRVQPLLTSIGSPKFYLMYARALETERKFGEAAAAYESAEEHGNAVRLYLGPLKNPSEAFAVVRKTRSMEGANIASKYCKNTGDYANAIEFLILQKRTQEARELAQQHAQMDIYTERVADIASKEECLKLARYYEAIDNCEKATIMFERCGDYKQALKLYLLWGTATAIEKAIDMVGRIRDDILTSQLLDFLMGDMEGLDKNPHYLFHLHTVLGNYDSATKAALRMAQLEQEKGNYKIAHQQLFDLSKLLQSQQRRMPFELSKELTLLHSYTLVKTLIRLGDHRSSARMLIRVARHISKFPAHVLPILISTVIECQRSGLKKTAFEYASMLMRPEFRNQITGMYKRKIENIVRKPERMEEDEQLSPCPFCQSLIPETQLECPTCKNYLPFCIASGRHLVVGNWTKCPSCQFPALTTEFTKIIKVEKTCPMCWKEVLEEDIMEIEGPIEDMRAQETLLMGC